MRDYEFKRAFASVNEMIPDDLEISEKSINGLVQGLKKLNRNQIKTRNLKN